MLGLLRSLIWVRVWRFQQWAFVHELLALTFGSPASVCGPCVGISDRSEIGEVTVWFVKVFLKEIELAEYFDQPSH
jgi:hypothetical protein